MPTVLILGAASDMAVAIANTFASKGYDVQLAARNAARLQPLQSDLGIRFNRTVTSHEFDASQFASHQSFFDALTAKPDVTVCVFGYMSDNEIARKEWKETESMIVANYTGAVSILNIISNYYGAQKKGTIVGISSVAGERGRQSNYIYGSAKAGFTAYLAGLRNRMVQDNVHVVTVKPGFVYTKMTENLTLPKLLTATPEQVAAVVFKAADAKKNVVYVKWFWRWIMLIIKSVPEFIFKKLKM
ncbi:MAG: SDR family oxidoreductase [Chitinophagaceae bacterium]|nr:MAG: SDR family oxidoreductase [Chitinophagaceae bacterium]